MKREVKKTIKKMEENIGYHLYEMRRQYSYLLIAEMDLDIFKKIMTREKK